MAKLADALDLGSSVRKDVWVQVPPSAPKIKDPLLAGLFHLAATFTYLFQSASSSQRKVGIDEPRPTTTANCTFTSWRKWLY